ncbi:MAG: DUF3015 domain-containing protein [Gammaproteobacteria bacterium]
MKKFLVAVALSVCSTSVFAQAAGGNGCGWGQLLFDGQSGAASHILGMTTNGTSGNNTFGVTTGTNGCSASGTIKYGGKSMVAVGNHMDEFSEDVARGDGEVLTAVAVTLEIAPEDRAYFKATMRDNFDRIFTGEDVTQEDVLANMWQVLGEDEVLNQYI